MARIGNYEADLQNNTLYWSAIIREIHEVDDDFVPALEAAINFYKAGLSRNSITHAVQAAIDYGTPFDLQLQIITAKGNERWVRVIGNAELLDGKCIKLNGSFQDIDAGKKAEIEVLKVYEEKNDIFESITDGFYALDKNWIVTYWNKWAEVILKKKRAHMVGKNLWEEFPEAVNAPFYDYYHQATKNNEALHFEEHYEKLGLWVEVSVYPSTKGLSVYFKDVTESKHLELEHTKMTEDIVQRNKDLEQYSYIVSHNLRAPVANIIGLSEELNNDTHTSDDKKMFNQELSHSVKRLDDVIIDLNNILQVNRQISERKETVNLSHLVADIQSGILNLIQKEHVQIRTDFSRVNEFNTLKSYLHSILFNLISNSIKYRQPGLTPIIDIRSEQADGKMVITFKDNGTGIDLEKKGDQVFGLYKRFHKNIEGKGIGLFMVKTQVETLGGKITVNSAINKGTEFIITFKL